MTACAFKGCDGDARARGYCWPHYVQLRRAKGDASKLKVLRGSTPPLIRVSLRLPPPTASAVRADTAGARAALARWADGDKAQKIACAGYWTDTDAGREFDCRYAHPPFGCDECVCGPDGGKIDPRTGRKFRAKAGKRKERKP